MNKFRKGDRVRNIEKGQQHMYYDLTGTILEDHEIPYVEWDEKIRCGDSAKGLGKYGYCMPQHEDYLELIEKDTEQLLKITFKGQEITISELKQLLKEVEDLKE